MAEPLLAEPDPDPDNDGWLGDCHRGPAVFSVYRERVHPLSLPEYRIECNDGGGPRVICRFVDEADPVIEWFGAWSGDQWCDWILAEARKHIKDSTR
jgi:hypothetical protein